MARRGRPAMSRVAAAARAAPAVRRPGAADPARAVRGIEARRAGARRAVGCGRMAGRAAARLTIVDVRGPTVRRASPRCGERVAQAIAMRLVLDLQLLEGAEQLSRLAGVVADALALFDDVELALLVTATVPDGLLGLVERPLCRRPSHVVGTRTARGWFRHGSSLSARGAAPGDPECLSLPAAAGAAVPHLHALDEGASDQPAQAHRRFAGRAARRMGHARLHDRLR